MAGAPIKRSVTLAGHRTSVSLEAEFWDALQDIAKYQKLSVSGLISRIDTARAASHEMDSGLSGAVRRYVLAWYRDRAK